eukprot:gb/GEZJ01007071.1/.p1 GENE.gb/GEZJ01007071.1/~~gb/GEZJ01007071.1/.p1  ORF type:complete len:213 (-),score=27.09 gb/GEZJ01007071.1/:125-709(-)
MDTVPKPIRKIRKSEHHTSFLAQEAGGCQKNRKTLQPNHQAHEKGSRYSGIVQERYWSRREKDIFVYALFNTSCQSERERIGLIAKAVASRNEKQVKAHRQKFFMRVIRDAKEDYFAFVRGERRARTVRRPNGSYHPRLLCMHVQPPNQSRIHSRVCQKCEKKGLLKNSSLPQECGLFLLAHTAELAAAAQNKK